jgi:hypothetical protein
MRDRLVRFGFVVAVLVGAPDAGLAQPAGSFGELVARGLLKPGDRIAVEGAAGRETAGVFRAATADELVVVRGDRMEVRFVEADVSRIRRAGGHAALWGTAIGAGSAVAITTWAAASYGENEGGQFCSSCLAQWGAFAVPVGAGIGAGIGFAIDRLHRSTVFAAGSTRRRVVALPVVSRHGAGLLVSARF